MKYVVEATKTNIGTRKLPMTEDVFGCLQAIIEDRERSKIEKVVDGHSDISVTLNTYTHLGFEDVSGELERIENEKKLQAMDEVYKCIRHKWSGVKGY